METTRARWWRHPGIELAIAALFVVGTALALGEVLHLLIPKDHGPGATLAAGAAAAAGFAAMYVLFCRLIERRPAAEFALPGALPELGMGLVTGIVLFSAVVAAIWAFGGYRVTGQNDASVLLPVLAMALASGVPEEIIFRGLLFRLLEKWLGSWWAIGISSIAFGAAHLGNSNATWFAAVAIALEAGIMLAAIFMITRRLWAAIGLHAAWNFAQGGIYGIAVSGGDFKGLLIPGPTPGASDLVTGGAFGAEASLPSVVIATAFGIVLLVIAHRRGRFIAPSWVLRRQGATAQE